MMYCSLEEAWGNKSISRYYDKTEKKKTIEPFKNNFYEDTDESIEHSDCNFQVSKVYQHIKKCIKCQKKLYEKLEKKFKPQLNNNNIINNFKNIIKNNNELVIIILLGISVLIFFNLIYSILNYFRKK